MSEAERCLEEHWHFTVRPGRAQRVYLVIDSKTLPSRWIEMQPVIGQQGVWDVASLLPKANLRFRYFIANDGTYLNCGTSGLIAQRTSSEPSAAQLKPMSREIVPA